MQIPAPFDYARATSVDDALALLERLGPEAHVVAGGHSLLPMMKLRLARPDYLVDINDCHELDYIVEQDDEVRVGALTRHRALLDSELIGRRLPIIHDAERVIADPVVRNRGTIGGSLCQADPAEDLSTVCDALAATAVIRGQDGTRNVAMSDFYHGPYQSAVDAGELLVELRFAVQPGTGSAYEKVERRVGDWAVTAAGTAVRLDGDVVADARIGLTAVGRDGKTATAAEDVLRGQPPSEEAFATAGRAAADACDPISDQRGPADYKRHLAGELTTRALRRSVERALRQETW